MLNWLFSKPLNSVLNETKVVKIKGVAFRIKKLNALEYAMGFHVLKQTYDVYKTNKPNQELDHSLKKVNEAVSHALVAGVVSPALSLKENDDGKIFVEKLFVDLEITNKLYEEIINYTYGKKKVNKFQLLGIKLLKLMRFQKDTV